jgi:hypothetical protein
MSVMFGGPALSCYCYVCSMAWHAGYPAWCTHVPCTAVLCDVLCSMEKEKGLQSRDDLNVGRDETTITYDGLEYAHNIFDDDIPYSSITYTITIINT